MEMKLSKNEVESMHNRIDELYNFYFDKIQNKIFDKEYYRLHKDKLTPLNLKIDCNSFLSELEQYQSHFYQWGTKHTHLPRQGIALVNQDGTFKENDPANYPGDEWNRLHPEKFLLEYDHQSPTPLMDINSLSSLKIFEDYFFRSNILKWGEGAKFYPHFDNKLPAPWLRLWGTTHPENTIVRFWDAEKEAMIPYPNIEAGRLYLIDTTLVHDSICTKDITYHFFICLSNSAKSIIQHLTF